jgi:hypothetical protein
MIVGVEHELYVRSGETAVDFRTLIDTIGLAGRRIDPGDDRAYRLDTGHVITCDDGEAEYAISPVPVRPGFIHVVETSCEAVAGELWRALPAGHSLTGASTHISVSCPDHWTQRVASMIRRHFAPAIMLVAENEASYGLLIRPRFGRVELGLDYVSGAALRATMVMATGAVQTCVDVLDGHRSASELPPPLVHASTPARRRYGAYISRIGFGDDLYTKGRSARLILTDGGLIEAGSHLELAWKSARTAIEGSVGPSDLNDADDIIAGIGQLPSEVAPDLRVGRAEVSVLNPFAGVTSRIDRPMFSASALIVTWDIVVFVVSGHRRCLLVVPRAELAATHEGLRRGELDDQIVRYLDRDGPPRPVPSYPMATRATALYDTIGPRTGLITPERSPHGHLELADGTVLSGPAAGSESPAPTSDRPNTTARPADEASSDEQETQSGSRHGKVLLPPPGSEEGSKEDEDETVLPPPRGCWRRFFWILIGVIAIGTATAVALTVPFSSDAPASTTTTTTTNAVASSSTTSTTTSVEPPSTTTTTALATTTTTATATGSSSTSTTTTTTTAVAPTTTTGTITTTTAVAPTTTTGTITTTTEAGTTTTTSAAPPPASKSYTAGGISCPGPSSWAEVVIVVNIPADAINPTHTITSGMSCPDTTTSVTSVSATPPTYTITIRGTAGAGGDGAAATSVSVTVTWTNP